MQVHRCTNCRLGSLACGNTDAPTRGWDLVQCVHVGHHSPRAGVTLAQYGLRVLVSRTPQCVLGSFAKEGDWCHYCGRLSSRLKTMVQVPEFEGEQIQVIKKRFLDRGI
ncbi:hypothetical protein COP2_036544 [Malus domestica]